MKVMDDFFSPRSVAIIGASRNPAKVGHVVFRNFIEGPYKGKIYPINPNTPELFGYRCYSSVLHVPGPVDLAVITVPAPLVLPVLEECGKKRIPAAIIISAGFGEIGNHELEAQVVATAKKHHIRFLGPNCFGVVDPATGVDTMFLPRFKIQRPTPGAIAYISQSGATLSVVLDWMGMKGYRISKFISYGNAADIDEADLMAYLADDPATKVICGYFEGVREGRKFFAVAKRISQKKPIVVLKGGQTAQGGQATLSHTGSLAGEARIYDAAFKQAGIIHAANLEQVFDFARVFATQPAPKGDRVQIITDGGGYGVLTTDAVIRNDLRLAQMRPQTVLALQKAMPSHVVIKNPMDLTGDATTERYRLAIEAAVADPGVDMLAVIVLFQVPALTGDVVEVIEEAKSAKPMVVIAGGGKYTETLKKPLEDGGVPTFSYPEQAIASLRALYDFSHR
ncbi:MAG: CoA-binding protein [Candidatus Aenigmarchaeota archaeon]|nr:CoA-binding protein [Candidatus Aenigmarchaeota archaeon]